MNALSSTLLFFCTALTLCAGEPTWKIAVIGDTHDEVPQNPAHHGVAKEYIDHAYQNILKHKVDMVVQVGDLSDARTKHYPAGMDFRASLNKVLQQRNIPFFAVRGNHDQTKNDELGFVKNFFPDETKQQLKDFYKRKLTYGFRHKNVMLYFLDVDLTNQPNNLLKIVEDIERRQKQGFTAPIILIFSHYPLQSPHNLKEGIFGASNDAAGAIQNKVYEKLANLPMPLWIAGHLHAHILATYKAPNLKSSLLQLTCAPCGEKAFPLPLMTEWGKRVNLHQFQSIVTGYYILTISEDQIQIDFYGAKSPCNGNVAPPVKQYKKRLSWSIPIKASPQKPVLKK